jgi:phosphate-selective porin OprO/OprP
MELKMQFKRKLLSSVIASIVISGGPLALSTTAYANDSSELKDLRALVQQLDQKVKVLERKGEISEEDTTTAKKATPVVRASQDGFGLKSADGKNEIKFRALAQIDF